MEKIIEHIKSRLVKYEISFMRFVDISDLPKELTLGCSAAILLGIRLPGEFISKINDKIPITYNEFDVREERVKRLADFVADYLNEEGYESYSQSCEFQLERKSYDLDRLRTRLPHKTLAVRAGLGWIGKNDLCNTHAYGCAISMCSVLTTAPFECVRLEAPEPKCGQCTICRDICPTGAISGTSWRPGLDRDELVDTSKCVICLKCLAACPFTKAKIKSA